MNVPEEADMDGPMDISTVFFAAKEGEVDALVWLAHAHREGKYVDKDPKEAMKMFKRAARRGHVCAQRMVGQAYLTGTGVRKNLKLADFWLRRAANQGCNCALLAIGAGCLEGNSLPADCEITCGCAGK